MEFLNKSCLCFVFEKGEKAFVQKKNIEAAAEPHLPGPARKPARESPAAKTRQPPSTRPLFFSLSVTDRWAHVVSTDASSTSRGNLAPDLARRRRRSSSSIHAIKSMIPFPECVYLNPCPSSVIPLSRRSFLATRLLAPTPATRRTPPPYSSRSDERRRPPTLSLAPFSVFLRCASS